MNGLSNGNHSAADIKMVSEESSPRESASSSLPVADVSPPLPPQAPPAMTTPGRNKTHSDNRPPPRRRRRRSCCGVVWSVMGHALVAATSGLLFGSYYLEYFANRFWLPQLDLMHFSERGKGERGLTYYHRVCGAHDMSTTDPTDFTVTNQNDTSSTDEAVHLMLRHGTTLWPGLLSPATAAPLRDFILRENQVNRELIHVIENKHRWSFPIQVDQDPSVTAALTELLSHDHLVRLLEALCGPDPAIIEFTAITAAEGAAQQYWHQDVVSSGSAAKYARHFIPSYSLFVPLQDTTAEMGATGVCPGTHMCSKTAFCEQTGFQVSGPANLWPLGAGALVNQQTTHRGEKHWKGPHRVVFILTFAPRPRVGPFTVETRMIGTSGSYSLHWSQWGHTLSDFRDSNRHMKWRFLRSLGLYKAKDRHWGWDYVTTSLMRITHEESGFNHDDLTTFLKKGGLRWLPKFLQGSIAADVSSTESSWTIYLRDTLKKCQKALLVLHGCVLFIVGTAWLISSCLRLADRTNQGPFLTLFAIHLSWLLGIWSLHQRVQSTPWARNISRGLANHVPTVLTIPHTQDSAATLPAVTDFMKADKMQSRYMWSFVRVLDVAHPGNAAFYETADHFSYGYSALSHQLQRKLRIDLNRALDGQRVLAQTASSGWAEVSLEDRDLFLHESMLRYTVLAPLLRELSFLLSECRFGFHRGTAMHKTHVPQLLLTTKMDLLTGKKSQRREASSHPVKLCDEKSTRKNSIDRNLFKRNDVKRIHGLSDLMLDLQTSPASKITPTFLSVGDPVEAIFGRDSAYWYRGTIVGAKPYKMKWVVQFDDGDVEGNAYRSCVVPSYPYRVDDTIEVKLGDPDGDEYEEGKVMAVYSDSSVDVKVGYHVVKRVRPALLRRALFEQQRAVSIGAKVLARYPGAGKKWYPGTVDRVNDNGSLAIAYDDGDYLDEVPTEDVRLQ